MYSCEACGADWPEDKSKCPGCDLGVAYTIPGEGELVELARRVAVHVAKNQSHMDVEDLQQEAMTAIVGFAVPNYDPARGPFKPWAWNSAIRPCLWASCLAGRGRSRREEIAEKTQDWREPVQVDVDRGVDLSRWRARVLAALAPVLEEEGAQTDDLLVLMRERSFAEHASAMGEPVARVRARCQHLRRRCAQSGELRQLFREMPR